VAAAAAISRVGVEPHASAAARRVAVIAIELAARAIAERLGVRAARAGFCAAPAVGCIARDVDARARAGIETIGAFRGADSVAADLAVRAGVAAGAAIARIRARLDTGATAARKARGADDLARAVSTERRSIGGRVASLSAAAAGIRARPRIDASAAALFETGLTIEVALTAGARGRAVRRCGAALTAATAVFGVCRRIDAGCGAGGQTLGAAFGAGPQRANLAGVAARVAVAAVLRIGALIHAIAIARFVGRAAAALTGAVDAACRRAVAFSTRLAALAAIVHVVRDVDAAAAAANEGSIAFEAARVRAARRRGMRRRVARRAAAAAVVRVLHQRHAFAPAIRLAFAAPPSRRGRAVGTNAAATIGVADVAR